MYSIPSGNLRIAVYGRNPWGRQTISQVHGWPLSHRMYEYQEEFLVDKGYRVITVNLVSPALLLPVNMRSND